MREVVICRHYSSVVETNMNDEKRRETLRLSTWRCRKEREREAMKEQTVRAAYIINTAIESVVLASGSTLPYSVLRTLSDMIVNVTSTN